MTDLIKISGCENPDRGLDLIFVHGLDGDGRSTWQKDDDPANFWPGWLGEGYPDIGIWSLDYEVSASDWKGHSMPLYNRARNSLELLDLKKIGHRPIGFVCHSLGGLLVKQMLRLANEFHHVTWKAVAEQTRFIVFLSTPHSGADMANWINYIGKLLRTSVSVKELEANNPQLLQLNAWYRQNAGKLKIKTHVFFENLPTLGVLVVNETSADPGITDVHPIPLDADHISICKLDKKSGHVYERIERLLDETLAVKQNYDDEILISNNGTQMPSNISPYSGEAKVIFCKRLGHSWQELADLLEIPHHHQARFDKGLEPKAIWEWLENKGQLNKLPGALKQLDRSDLTEELSRRPT